MKEEKMLKTFLNKHGGMNWARNKRIKPTNLSLKSKNLPFLVTDFLLKVKKCPLSSILVWNFFMHKGELRARKTRKGSGRKEGKERQKMEKLTI